MLSVIPRARQNDALFQSEPKMFLDKSPHSCFPGYILKRRLDEQPLRETLSPLSRFQTQYDSSRRCKKREQSSPCPPIINMQLQDFFKNYKTSSPRLLPQDFFLFFPKVSGLAAPLPKLCTRFWSRWLRRLQIVKKQNSSPFGGSLQVHARSTRERKQDSEVPPACAYSRGSFSSPKWRACSQANSCFVDLC